MRYLLDVNAMIGWEHPSSPHHKRFHAWLANTKRDQIWTCALAELGFIRVSMQAFTYSAPQATAALAALKEQTGGFVAATPSPLLPAWATTADRTTDAYLVQIAQSNDKMSLVTFDSRIKGAVFIGPARA